MFLSFSHRDAQAFDVLLKDVEAGLRGFEVDLINFRSGESWVRSLNDSQVTSKFW